MTASGSKLRANQVAIQGAGKHFPIEAHRGRVDGPGALEDVAIIINTLRYAALPDTPQREAVEGATGLLETDYEHHGLAVKGVA